MPIPDPILAEQLAAERRAELEKAVAIHEGRPDVIRDQYEATVKSYLKEGREAKRRGGSLFPKKNRDTTDRVTALPYFGILSALRPDHRAFWVESGDRQKFEIFQSIPYGPTPTPENPSTIIYQRICVFLKDKKLGAFLHLLDSGDSHGPDLSSAVIDMGALFLKNENVPFMSQGGQLASLDLEPTELRSFLDTVVKGELTELEDTGQSVYDSVQHRPIQAMGRFAVGVGKDIAARIR